MYNWTEQYFHIAFVTVYIVFPSLLFWGIWAIPASLKTGSWCYDVDAMTDTTQHTNTHTHTHKHILVNLACNQQTHGGDIKTYGSRGGQTPVTVLS